MAVIHIQRNDPFHVHEKAASFRLHISQGGCIIPAEGNKQMNDKCLTDSIYNPFISEIKANENECYILMDYIYANNFIDYFEKASPQDINHFIDNFIQYIHNEIDKCEIKKISKNVYINKFNSVVKNCEKNELLKGNMRVKSILKDCENVFTNLPEEIELPVGICHGDLTFSNILFASNKFYFILVLIYL